MGYRFAHLSLLWICLGLAPATRPATFKLTSPAVGKDGQLPVEFTCDGARLSPPLAWENAPAGTKAFAVTMHHFPQFGAGVEDRHCYLVLYNLPATATGIARAYGGPGDWGANTVNDEREYAPPCSRGPGKKVYTLTVYALSDRITVEGKRTMSDLEAAMKDKTLSTAKLDVWHSRGEDPNERKP